MKSKAVIILIHLLSYMASPLFAVEDTLSEVLNKGRAVYEQFCYQCHIYDMAMNDQEEPPSAPPIRKISERYHAAFSQEDEAVEHMVSFIKDPKAEDTKFGPGVINRFGLKPPMDLEDEDLRAVSHWVWQAQYEPELSDWLHVTVEMVSPSAFIFHLSQSGSSSIVISSDAGVKLFEAVFIDSVFTWEGTDSGGNPLSAGTYQYTVLQGQTHFSGAITIFVENTDSVTMVLQQGEMFFRGFCKLCHTLDGESTVAPSVKRMSEAYHQAYSEKQAGLEAMLDFVLAPSLEKSVLTEEEKQKYNLMVPILRPKEQLEPVVLWIWESYSNASIYPNVEQDLNYLIELNPQGWEIHACRPLPYTSNLNIMDVKGNLLNVISVTPGSTKIIWRGRDKNGRRLPPGIYPYVWEGTRAAGVLPLR